MLPNCLFIWNFNVYWNLAIVISETYFNVYIGILLLSHIQNFLQINNIPPHFWSFCFAVTVLVNYSTHLHTVNIITIIYSRDVTRPQPHEAEAEAEATIHEAEAEAEAEATTHEAEAEAEATTHEAEAEAEAKTHL